MSKHDSSDPFKYIRKRFEISAIPQIGEKDEHPELSRYEYVAYKPDFPFLREGLNSCYHLKTDKTLLPESKIYYRDGVYLMSREIYPEYIIQKDELKIDELSEGEFTYCLFEPINGYLIGDKITGYDLMIHNYSGGLELFSISKHAPLDFRNMLSKLAAGTFAELHNLDILYHDSVPTNIRYNFADKLVLNPHKNIFFEHCGSDEKTHELALFLRTNNWLPNSDDFLDEYFAKVLSKDKIKNRIQAQVLSHNDDVGLEESLKDGIHSFWR